MTTRSGLLLVDKETGLTSHDVIAKLRKILDEQRVGHAGTLDPMATGLLVVAVGAATRLIRFAQGESKRYVGTVTFGVSTASLDADGVVTGTAPVPALTQRDVDAAAALVGSRTTQVPPMVSALKVDGRRLHALAREGRDVERLPRSLAVTEFSMAPTERVEQWTFEVACSPGTYVRVLLADVAEQLGTLGHLSALRRVSSGALRVTNAHTINDVASMVERGVDPLNSPNALVSSLLAVRISDDQAVAMRHGQRLALGDVDAVDAVAAIDDQGELVGVLVRRGELWKPDVVLGAFG
jgi:tRNA pseudouridine55 synthase